MAVSKGTDSGFEDEVDPATTHFPGAGETYRVIRPRRSVSDHRLISRAVVLAPAFIASSRLPSLFIRISIES